MAIITSAGNYAHRTSGIVDNAGPYTVMAWVYRSSLSGVQWVWGTAAGSDDFNGAAWEGDYVGFYGDRFSIGCNDGETADYTNPTNSAGVWYHICIKRVSTTNLRGLLNGDDVVDRSTDVSGRTANGFESLGQFNNNAFDGRIAAFKAWSAALSDEEIAAEMSVGPPVRTSNLIIYTPINAANLNDSLISVTGSNWTANGTPTVEDGPPIDWGGGGGGNALLLQLMQHGHLNGGLL